MTEAEKALFDAAMALDARHGDVLPAAWRVAKARDAVLAERMDPELLLKAKTLFMAHYSAEKRWDAVRNDLENNGIRLTGESGLIATSWYEEAKAAYG